MINITWKPVSKEKCELDGPYEYQNCGGHIMFDITYLKQVTDEKLIVKN